jgi:predicted small metal-binding protein
LLGQALSRYLEIEITVFVLQAIEKPTGERSYIMGRKYIDCQEMVAPGGAKCNERITADTEKELLELAGRHAINVHGHSNIASYREKLLGQIKEVAAPK